MIDNSFEIKLYDAEEEDEDDFADQYIPTVRLERQPSTETKKSIFSGRWGSRTLSKISRMSSSYSVGDKAPSQLDEDEIQTVINALLNKEYLLRANSTGNEQELEFGLETSKKYLQSSSPKKLSDSYL